jgi:hypothetical protein
MEILRNRESADKTHRLEVALVLSTCVMVAVIVGGTIRGADEATASAVPVFRQYCFQCHGKTAQMAGLSLEQLTSQSSIGDSFQQWEKVAAALEQNRMPPKGMPQPSDAQRRQAVSWIRSELNAFVKKHDGDPGRVTVRRLTSGEYGYTIQDLTGLDLDVGIDSASDSVGGEGFTNFGDVQFMQDANLERYLEAAKIIADHAVIGSGAIEFFSDPGKTGFEFSAITRIKDIYAAHGFRTVSGEGGRPFGLDKYAKALYVAWRYRHRAALGESNVTLKDLAAREGISIRFAQHISTVMNNSSLGYPPSEVAARWRKLPAPGADGPVNGTADGAARAGCEAIGKFLTTWPSWLFSRGDVAAGGAGDESPLQLTEASLKTEASHHFTFNVGGRGGARGRGLTAGPAKIYLNVAPVNPNQSGNPVVIWRNPTVAFRRAGPGRGQPATVQSTTIQPATVQPGVAQPAVLRNLPPAGPRQALRAVVSEETAKKLAFGKSPDGTAIGPDDFASELSVSFEVPVPEGAFGADFQVDAQIGRDRDQVFRITLSDREDGGARGIPTRSLLADPQSAGYRKFKAGVLELAAILPPNSHSEPTPADKDPVPEPFDSAFNVPEHDAFDTNVKYHRDDRFVVEYMLDDATRARLDHAWNDLYSSFEYHDNYLTLLAQHFGLDLKGKHIADLDEAQLAAMPAEPRKYIKPLLAEYKAVLAAEAAARPRHVEDCIRFASRAWRRPLSEKEKQSLRSFYDKTITSEPDHPKAIRALLARILVSPAFLYRVEQPAEAATAKSLSQWEMASRLSYFLWSSIPDEELRRAAAAGELINPQQVQRQVKRMLADPKARRLSTEFFGQWLGFYHFDQHKGVDTSRFPEFTDEVKGAMYDEAVSFFEHVIRKDRPLREILFADYAFLNQPLAKYYGVTKEVKSKDQVELVEGANGFQRGGMLRLGAMLTVTSAPLRTSPVKRGDYVLRRVLGTAVPPPPADAGSIPTDDKLFGGLSVRERMEVHKRNATCANCHARIDPLGFPLEHYDSTGRWREKYPDGKPIDDSGALPDQTQISGVKGLLDYLQVKQDQVRRTLSYKLLGYALGRTILASDQPLIDRLVAAGGDAGFSDLVTQIATSRQFRNRVGRDEGPTAAPRAATVKTAGMPAVKNSDKVGER